jgi:hypothetical protein
LLIELIDRSSAARRLAPELRLGFMHGWQVRGKRRQA